MGIPSEPRPLTRWIGPAISVAVFLIMLSWTWGKWPDALIDFGRELYVPWQLSEGKRLYADIAYFNGPLSPSFNAVLFATFGVGLRTLAVANAVIAGLIAIMIYSLLRILCGRFVATAGTVALFVFFEFAQFMPRGNYNYIAPYSHEATHGTALAAAALLLLAIHLRRGGGKWTVLAAGGALGLTFLTKAEFVIALVPALGAGFVLHHYFRKTPRHEALTLAALFLTGALAAPLIALLLLLTYLSPGQALKGVVGSWAYIFNEELGRLPFYREIRGTLDVGASLRRIGAWTLRHALALAPAFLAGFALPRRWRGRWVAIALLAAVSAATVLIGRKQRAWEDLSNPWSLFLFVAVVVSFGTLFRRSGDEEESWRRVLTFSCLVYASALMLKMMLNVRVLHYGFVLAMPAGVALVAILTGAVPAWLDRRGRNGMAFRAVALGALLAFAFVQLWATDMWLGTRTVTVADGEDRFVVQGSDTVFVDLMTRLDRLRDADDTLLVLPEGVMLNYLLRMENPTGHVNFMPPELIMFGEDSTLEAVVSGAPDWVVIVNRGAHEYGYRMLGDDYGREIISWVERDYRVVDRVFRATAHGPLAFAAILCRNDRPAGLDDD